jgi:hypothetical protein
MTSVIDETLTLLRVHRNNIHRYCRLLKTELADLERTYIERRLLEEETAMKALADSTFPLTFPATSMPRANALFPYG